MRKGSKHTQETIEKIRIIKKAQGGHTHSEESKAKIRTSKLGSRNPNYGKQPSAETRRKLSLSRTGTKNHQWGKPRTKEVRAKISASLKGSNSPNYGKPRDDAIVRKVMLSNRVRPNKAELKLQEILDRYFPKQWKFVGDGEVIIGGLCPDFINVNNEKTLLELYGSYWHSSKLLRNWKSTELGRIMHYNSYGFKCLIIWEKELGNEDALIRKIKTYGKHTRS